MLKLYGYKKCDACRKAEKFFQQASMTYEFVDITENPPTPEALADVVKLASKVADMVQGWGLGPSMSKGKRSIDRHGITWETDVWYSNLVERPFKTADEFAIVIEKERLAPLDRACETAVQMLRLTEGIKFELFQRVTGYNAAVIFAGQIRRYCSAGLMHAAPDTLRLTRRGMLLANRIMSDFLPDVAFVAANA